MKIEKVIWSCTPEYCDFWEINSYVFKKFLQIEPVLIFFGNPRDYNLSQKYGQIIPASYEVEYHQIVQMIWSKWHYTQLEPDTVWLIGDIDQIPLQKDHFAEPLIELDSSSYAHLSVDSFSSDWAIKRERLVGHYHVAKGKTFSSALDLNLRSLMPHVSNLVLRAATEKKPVWAYEEWYTADLIRQNFDLSKFYGFNRSPKLKICRSNNSNYSQELLNAHQYIDYHCPRPFLRHQNQIVKIIEKAWNEPLEILG
jgi:hypothetical protein